mmetsp:Transcript_3554/g.7952  ORF Transcript_3554/g.7952 Transcript_3554/m.7952 type:complete len:245 (-) Transcript_3554:818-1552(-)
MRPCRGYLCVVERATSAPPPSNAKRAEAATWTFPTTPCMLRRALRPVSSRGVLVPTGPAANKVPAPPRRPRRPRRRRRSRPLTDWLAAAPDLHPPRLGVGGVDIPDVVLQLLRPLEQEAREVLGELVHRGAADDGGAHEGAAVAVRDGELRGCDAVLLGHGHVGVHRRGALRLLELVAVTLEHLEPRPLGWAAATRPRRHRGILARQHPSRERRVGHVAQGGQRLRAVAEACAHHVGRLVDPLQ